MFKITKLIEFFVTKFDTISTLRYGVSWVPSYSTWHRISTARREKGRGGSSSFKLNLTDPCHT